MKLLQLAVLLMTLSGCTRFNWNYQPQLATAPKNAERYERDRQECFAEIRKIRKENQNKTRTRNALATGGLGLIGYAIVESSEPTNPKSPAEMTDDCMAAKGYDVVRN